MWCIFTPPPPPPPPFSDDHSRVVLEKIKEDPHSDYYNANYLKVSCFRVVQTKALGHGLFQGKNYTEHMILHSDIYGPERI